jgi:TonB family protein
MFYLRFANLRRTAICALIVCNLGTEYFHTEAVAQPNQPAQANREIIRRVQPAYPPMARRALLTGTVRLRVKVTAEGRIASIQVLGGNPVFVQAGVEAVKKWRWERASGNTYEFVKLTFENP